jgi:hypothetical protein
MGRPKRSETTGATGNERGIEATLSALGIDPDATPEEAIYDTQNALNEGAVLGADDELPPLDLKDASIPPSRGEDFGGDGGGDDAPGNLDAVFLPDPDRPPPMPMGLMPSPPRPKAQTRDRASGAGKLAKSLADKVPGADKVKVYKREGGRRWFIQDYTANDLKQFPDFESFLTRYVKPDHGSGEYDLVGVDGMNRDIELGQVRLIGTPNTKSPESSAMALVEKMMTEQRQRDEEWMQRTQAQQMNPLELLTGVMALKEKVDGEAGGGLSTAMKAMSESSTQTMQMFMAMMQQQQAAADRQNQLMMALLTKPREEDPVMKMLLMKLVGDGATANSGGALPPPPPPPSPTSGLSEVLTAMAAFMQATSGGGGEGDTDFKDFLKAMVLQKQGEQLGTKDILELVTKGVGGAGGKDGSDAFRATIDNVAALMNVAQNLNKGSEGGPAAGLFDALAALFNNRDFAGSVAGAIRSKLDQNNGSAEERLKAERQRIQMELRLLDQKRNELLQLSGQTRTAPPAAAPPSAAQPSRAPEEAVSRPIPQPRVVSAEVQQAADRTVERTGRIPQLPANTHEHLNGILTAKDEADLVAKTVALFIYFAEFDDWRGFIEQLLRNMREGNKQKSLEYVGAFFGGLTEIGLVEPSAAKTILATLQKHYDAVKEQLADLQFQSDGDITAESLLAGEGAEATA